MNEVIGMDRLEIEHKFVVGDDFALEAFLERCAALKPLRQKQLDVRDRYYLLPGRHDLVLRHRFDEELQQLTVKSRGTDAEIRQEINLDLIPGSDQGHKVEAWTALLGATAAEQINKAIWVFDFPDCEVVYYEAQHEESGRQVRCVEIEAKGAASVADALRVLEVYEDALGFRGERRSQRDLLSLLLSPTAAPAEGALS